MKLKVVLPDEQAMEEARHQWDSVAKPLHSLGAFEDLLIQIAGITGNAQLNYSRKCMVIFCGDHGVTEMGVTQTDSRVTGLVAQSILKGHSSINALTSAPVFVVDMGMAYPPQDPGLLNFSQRQGSRNLAEEAAMTIGETERAIESGITLMGRLKAQGFELAGIGEMGIGNTTAAAAMGCAFFGLSPEETVGRGAGLSDEGLRRKQNAVRMALQRGPFNDPMTVLQEVGGYEIAGMTGAYLGAMVHRIPAVVDGLISAMAAYCAVSICPQCRPFLLPSHLGIGPLAQQLMQEMKMSPVLHAGMHLGEGTGAAMLFPLLDLALQLYHGQSFSNLGIDPYTESGEE